MQIVINIPEDDYRKVQDGRASVNMMRKAIRNGTPLPKGHGDLKDMSNLQYVFDLTREDPIYSGKDIEWAIKSMKTIIEADKESEGTEDNIFKDITDEDQAAIRIFLNEILAKMKQWTKEAEEAGMTLPEYFESINPFRKNYKCKYKESKEER